MKHIKDIFESLNRTDYHIVEAKKDDEKGFFSGIFAIFTSLNSKNDEKGKSKSSDDKLTPYQQLCNDIYKARREQTENRLKAIRERKEKLREIAQKQRLANIKLKTAEELKRHKDEMNALEMQERECDNELTRINKICDDIKKGKTIGIDQSTFDGIRKHLDQMAAKNPDLAQAKLIEDIGSNLDNVFYDKEGNYIGADETKMKENMKSLFGESNVDDAIERMAANFGVTIPVEESDYLNMTKDLMHPSNVADQERAERAALNNITSNQNVIAAAKKNNKDLQAKIDAYKEKSDTLTKVDEKLAEMKTSDFVLNYKDIDPELDGAITELEKLKNSTDDEGKTEQRNKIVDRLKASGVELSDDEWETLKGDADLNDKLKNAELKKKINSQFTTKFKQSLEHKKEQLGNEIDAMKEDDDVDMKTQAENWEKEVEANNKKIEGAEEDIKNTCTENGVDTVDELKTRHAEKKRYMDELGLQELPIADSVKDEHGNEKDPDNVKTIRDANEKAITAFRKNNALEMQKKGLEVNKIEGYNKDLAAHREEVDEYVNGEMKNISDSLVKKDEKGNEYITYLNANGREVTVYTNDPDKEKVIRAKNIALAQSTLNKTDKELEMPVKPKYDSDAAANAKYVADMKKYELQRALKNHADNVRKQASDKANKEMRDVLDPINDKGEHMMIDHKNDKVIFTRDGETREQSIEDWEKANANMEKDNKDDELSDNEGGDYELDADDNDAGDDNDVNVEKDDSGKKTLVDPTKRWHRKERKDGKGMTDGYYNKKGDRISPEDFKDRVENYKKRKGKLSDKSKKKPANEARLHTGFVPLKQFIYEQMTDCFEQ